MREGEKTVARRVREAEEEGRGLESKQEARMAEMEEEAESRMKEAVELIVGSILEET